MKHDNTNNEKNIILLFNTTKTIYETFNELMNLEIKNQTNTDEFQKKINYLNIIQKKEKELITILYNNNYIIDNINNYIKSNHPNIINNLITTRMINNINMYNYNNKYKEIIRSTPNTIKEKIEKGNYITNQIQNDVITDINNIVYFYINNFSQNENNEIIKNTLINYKYQNIFINSEDIPKYNNNNIYLTPDIIYNMNNKSYDINGTTIQTKKIFKNNIIMSKIEEYINDFINIPDIQFTIPEGIATATIIKFYIQAGLSLISIETKKELKKQIIKDIPNTLTKELLLDAFDTNINSNINNITLKIKNLKLS